MSMGVDISDEQIDDFGDKEYILDRIAKELNVQFNTRKQLLLKTLYAYIANSSTLDDLDCFSMFGTNSFNLVWEKVCAEVMDNQLQKPIGALRLPVPLAEQYRHMRHKKLIDLIDKPQWAGTAPSGEPFVEAHQIRTVRNCFLMPTMGSEVIEKGVVSLGMLQSRGLQSIQIRLLPVSTMYKHYVDNTKFNPQLLNL